MRPRWRRGLAPPKSQHVSRSAGLKALTLHLFERLGIDKRTNVHLNEIDFQLRDLM